MINRYDKYILNKYKSYLMFKKNSEFTYTFIIFILVICNYIFAINYFKLFLYHQYRQENLLTLRSSFLGSFNDSQGKVSPQSIF